MEGFDEAFEVLFERTRGDRRWHALFTVASELGDWSVLWHLIGVTAGVVDGRRVDDAFALSAVLGAESLLVNQGIKRLFHRPRPPAEALPAGVRRPTTSSFPSGHASAAFCAAAVLSTKLPAGRPLWYGAATVVAASRVHLKLHHASDVVAGVAVGVALGAIAKRVLSR